MLNLSDIVLAVAGRELLESAYTEGQYEVHDESVVDTITAVVNLLPEGSPERTKLSAVQGALHALLMFKYHNGERLRITAFKAMAFGSDEALVEAFERAFIDVEEAGEGFQT